MVTPTTMEEYMLIGLQNAGSFMLIAMTFIGMGDIVTLDCMNWIVGDPEPKIVRAMSVIGRVMNDIAYHKSEKRKSGHRVASAVECYMKQYETTEEEAISELCQQVTDAWKDVNKEFFHPTDIPMPLLMRVLDLVRVNHEMYRDGDGFTDSILLKDLIASLIVDPLSV
ncbi:(-)-germacrene D synthase [Morus notabilis]|uniref:(-)-germacrene D synthase n=1 Tax=Morus notabilis TaxID=981085 RepID=W9RII5_9ROSA|nr:(-)-germacrene D synthase [Morus notabilis]